jgi:hypothetical protein
MICFFKKKALAKNTFYHKNAYGIFAEKVLAKNAFFKMFLLKLFFNYKYFL